MKLARKSDGELNPTVCEMIVKRVPIKSVHLDPGNVRLHGKRNLQAIGASLDKFGVVEPLVVQKSSGKVIGGNARLQVLTDKGESEVDVVQVDVTDAEATALGIALNRTSELAEWDEPGLAKLLQGMTDDIDIKVAGFNGAELDQLVARALPPEIIEDDIPDPPKTPITKPGDLWKLGEHRALCGDATKAEDVERATDKAKVNTCVTDPPYGVGVEYGGFEDNLDNVKTLISAVMPLVLSAPCAALTPGVPAMWDYPKPSWVGAWVHPAPCGSCPWGFVGNNPILYYGADPYLKAGRGRRPDSIVMASDRQGVEGHPTPKPMKVWAWLVERLTPERGQIVLDPFLGSGTTLIAAEQLGRKCYGLEIEPKYCDVIVERWQNITGGKAKR